MICNEPVSRTFIEEDWPSWQAEGKTRAEYDEMEAGLTRKDEERRRQLRALAPTGAGQ